MNTTVSTPWASAVTADDGTLKARMTNVAKTVLTEPVAAGGNRTVETANTYDATYGYLLTVSVDPSDATATCTTTGYAAANTGAWIVGLPSESTTVAKTCPTVGSAQYPADLVSRTRTLYDGLAHGAAPTKGLPTSTQSVDAYSGSSPHWQTMSSTTYDALGRPLVATDAMGRTSTTAYTPATAVPLLTTAVTNTAPFSWTTNTSYDPTTGQPVSIVDPNGATTTIALDGLGRTSKVWLPLRPQSSNPTSPSLAFTYALSQTGANAVRTDTVTGGGTNSTWALYDGLARAVQAQKPAVGGGTVVSSTSYDDQGRAYWVDRDYWTLSVNPGATYFVPTSLNNIPSQTTTTFDAVGRPTQQTLNTLGVVRSQTVTAYQGADRVDVTPPAGGTPTTTFTNSLGKKTKLVQYLTAAPTGSGQATTYAYDGAGRMTTMTDPAGNDWTWEFDLLGRKIGQHDPDSGHQAATYDLAGNMTSATDARGTTVTTTYDALNRTTARYKGDASGSMLASWTYDTVKKGLATTTSSYSGSTPETPGDAYKTTVEGYNAAGQVTKSTFTVPSGAPAFAGTSYTTSYGYNADSTVSAMSVPAMGGLPAEIVRYTYDAAGRQTLLSGGAGVLTGTVYSPLGQLAQFNRSISSTSMAYSTYGYDAATGQVLGIRDNAVFDGAGHWVADRAYTRDAAGNVTSQTLDSVLPTAGRQRTCYSYDGLRQLTRAWTPNDQSDCSATPSAGTLGGITPMWLEYAYDTTTGNRTSLTHHDAAGTSSTATYAYDTARPHAVKTVSGPVDLGAGLRVRRRREHDRPPRADAHI